METLDITIKVLLIIALSPIVICILAAIIAGIYISIVEVVFYSRWILPDEIGRIRKPNN